MIAAHVMRLYAALGAGLSRVAGGPDGHPFVEVANAAPSFDPAEGATLLAANCAICHQAGGEGIPWGNRAPLVTAREVAAVRATLKQ